MSDAAPRGRLAAYARWQLVDYLIDRGASTAIIAVLFAVLFVQTIRVQFGAGWSGGPEGAVLARQVIQQTVAPFAFVAVLVTVQGMVATDRKLGYYRFLFAKPVSVPRYYVQAFGVYGAGLLALVAALLGVYAVLVRPVAPLPALEVVGIYFVALGGIGFLASALARFDWAVMAGLWMAGQVVRLLYGGSTSVAYRAADALLPPSHKIDSVAAVLFAGHQPRPAELVWLLGYGAVCVLLGALVLRWKALAE